MQNLCMTNLASIFTIHTHIKTLKLELNPQKNCETKSDLLHLPRTSLKCECTVIFIQFQTDSKMILSMWKQNIESQTKRLKSLKKNSVDFEFELVKITAVT